MECRICCKGKDRVARKIETLEKLVSWAGPRRIEAAPQLVEEGVSVSHAAAAAVRRGERPSDVRRQIRSARRRKGCTGWGFCLFFWGVFWVVFLCFGGGFWGCGGAKKKKTNWPEYDGCGLAKGAMHAKGLRSGTEKGRRRVQGELYGRLHGHERGVSGW